MVDIPFIKLSDMHSIPFFQLGNLLLKCWMLADMVLDCIQTKTYYDISMTDTTAMINVTTENQQRGGEINIGYFVCSVISLIAVPLLATICISCFGLIGQEKCRGGLLGCFAGLLVYLILPFWSIAVAVSSLCGVEESADQNVMLEVFKMFEQFGEAIPQVILAIVFFTRHSDWVYKNDMNLFGIIELPVPVTLISIIASFGSIIMGLVIGVKTICSCIKGSLNSFGD